MEICKLKIELLKIIFSLILIAGSMVSFGQNRDTVYNLSIRQVDSLIRFSEKVKSLTERYDFVVQETSTFKSLWQSEKTARAEDKKNYNTIIEGFSAIETSHRIQIETLNKKYKGAVRLGRFYLVIAVAGVGFGIYKTFF